MEQGGFNVPSCGVGAGNKGHAALIRAGFGADNGVAKGMLGIDVIGNLSFSGQDNVVVALLEFTDGNGQPRVAAIADIQCAKDNVWGSSLLLLGGGRSVKRVPTIVDGMGKSERHRWLPHRDGRMGGQTGPVGRLQEKS